MASSGAKCQGKHHSSRLRLILMSSLSLVSSLKNHLYAYVLLWCCWFVCLLTLDFKPILSSVSSVLRRSWHHKTLSVGGQKMSIEEAKKISHSWQWQAKLHVEKWGQLLPCVLLPTGDRFRLSKLSWEIFTIPCHPPQFYCLKRHETSWPFIYQDSD